MDDTQLPPQTTLLIDIIGSRNIRYVGEFIFKVPTLAMNIAIGRRKAELLGALFVAAADPMAAALAEQVAYLEATIETSPKLPLWWKPLEMFDAAPLSALYKEALRYEARFHGREPEQNANPASSSAEDGDAGGDGTAGAMEVGSDLPPAAKRSPIVISDVARSD